LKAAGKTEERAVIEVCPVCGSKLEKGYVASKVISWRDRKISNWWEWPPKGLLSGEVIVSGGFPYMSIINVEAYRCKKCKIIIFRYGEANDSAKENPP
jgi:hypothetical protein